MVFPEILNPTDPADNVVATVGPSELRAIKQLLADVFGLPISPTQITAGAFTISASGVLSILQAGPTVAADPTVPLGIATKHYVDASKIPVAIYQYTVLTSDVSVASNTQTQVLQTAVIPALATSPNGHWIVRVVARCLFQSSFAQVDNLAAFLQVNSDFISSYASSGANGAQALISAVLDHTLLVADGQTVQATMAVKAPGEGVVSALDPIFILRPTDITVVAQPQ